MYDHCSEVLLHLEMKFGTVWSGQNYQNTYKRTVRPGVKRNGALGIKRGHFHLVWCSNGICFLPPTSPLLIPSAPPFLTPGTNGSDSFFNFWGHFLPFVFVFVFGLSRSLLDQFGQKNASPLSSTFWFERPKLRYVLKTVLHCKGSQIVCTAITHVNGIIIITINHHYPHCYWLIVIINRHNFSCSQDFAVCSLHSPLESWKKQKWE